MNGMKSEETVKMMRAALFSSVIGSMLIVGAVMLHAAQDTKETKEEKKEEATPAVVYKDGLYKGEANGYKGPIVVVVKISKGKIDSVKVLKHEENRPKTALTDLPEKIVKANGTKGVDAVSGATFTSNGLTDAVKAALEKASAAAQKAESSK